MDNTSVIDVHTIVFDLITNNSVMHQMIDILVLLNKINRESLAKNVPLKR